MVTNVKAARKGQDRSGKIQLSGWSQGQSRTHRGNLSPGLLHSPAFSVSVMLILTLGIGASAAIFNLVDAYFLRPPPGVSDPDRLVDVRGTRGEKLVGEMTYPDYADLRDLNHVFSGLMAYRTTVLDVGRGSETRRVQAALVSSDYFAVLGASAVRGRIFLPEEERHAQGDPVAVISDRLWHGLFDANPDLVGKPVTLNGRRFTVVGVASPGFRGHTTSEAYDIWVPLAMFAVADPGALASIDSRTWRWLPGFFRTMGAGLVRGRDFSDRDHEGAGPVVIVNETLARRLWLGAIPLGQLLWIDGERSGREVVGVASDRPTPDGPRPFLYEPLFQRDPWAGSRHVLHVRTSVSPLAFVSAVQREAVALDVNLPLFNPRTLDREIAGGRFFERLAGAVVGGSGLLALLLAAIGLYGVTSYWASQRRHEFGIRVAMGAGTSDVLRLVVGQGMKLSLVGVAIGLVAALASNRVWASLLYGVRPVNLTVLAGVSLLLIASTLVASYLPARQATKVDQVTVMRAE